MGEAASAIAHDIDVAMAPITLYAEALLEHETLSERARHYLGSIRRAVDDVSHNVGRAARTRSSSRRTAGARIRARSDPYLLGAKPARVC